MNQEVAGPPQPPKKGMSKGCLVAIIIVGAIILIAAIGIGYICMNPEKALRAGVSVMFSGMVTELRNNPVEGVDTDQFEKVTKAFTAKLDGELTDAEMQRIGAFMQKAGELGGNPPYSRRQIQGLLDGMVVVYPDLEEMASTVVSVAEDVVEVDTLELQDSLTE